MICIIDYKMGNLRSVFNKFKRIGVECIISSDKQQINNSTKLVLPGVGHFQYGMQNLKSLGLTELLYHKVILQKTPILGICLGTQLFCNYSEEGDCNGLGWIEAGVKKFKVSNKIKYKVPHIGWNDIVIKNENDLNKNIKSEEKFYFVHSYHLDCKNISDIWMTTTYDYEFVSAIHHDNIYGTQFHPEKSHDKGYELLKNFTEL